MTSRKIYETLQHQFSLLEAETLQLREENRQLQEALRSQKQLEYLIETFIDPMWISDADATIKTVNRAFLELIGCSSTDEVVGKFIWDLSVLEEGMYESTAGEQVVIDWNYFERMVDNAAVLVEQGRYSGWKIYYRHKTSGKVIPATQNVVFLYGDQGQHLDSFGIIHDLTEIRAAEYRIELARGFLQNFFDTVEDGLFVTDTAGTIIMANKCFAAMIGYDDENLKGRVIYELVMAENDTDLRIPDSIKMLIEAGTIKGYETAFRRRDGSSLEVEINMNFLRKDDGSLSGIVCAVRDITERRLAQAALRESEEKYRSLIENMAIGIFRSKLDEQGTIIHANQGLAKMAGLDSADEMQGTSIDTFCVSPDERKTILREIISQKGYQGREFLFKKSNGDIRWGSVSATLLYNTNGEPFCIDGYIEDITERKQAEEFLHKSHEKLESMVQERTVALEEANTALRILLQARQADMSRQEETLHINMQKLVVPPIKKLKKLGLSGRALAYVDIISETISHIAEPLLKGTSLPLLNLTDSELQIVNLLKQRKSTREIAAITDLSPRTIDRHRDNIRKKLGLSNSKINLTTYLMSLK